MLCCFNTRPLIVKFKQLTSAAQTATSVTHGSATCTRSILIRVSQPTFPGRRFLLDASPTSWLPFGRRLRPASLLLDGRVVREDSSSLCRCLAQQQGFCRVGGGGETEERPGWRGLKAGWGKQGAQPGGKKKGEPYREEQPHAATSNRVRKGAGATRVTSSRSCQWVQRRSCGKVNRTRREFLSALRH